MKLSVHFALWSLASSLFIAPATWSKTLTNSLTVDYQGQQFSQQFTQPFRLEPAMNTLLTQQNWSTAKFDWLTSALFDVSAPYKLKTQVLTQIDQQIERADNDSQRAQWQSLKKQLSFWQYAKRLFISLDPDNARVSPKDNPRLSGQWHAVLMSNPSHVWVLGGVERSGRYVWSARHGADYYLQHARPVAVANDVAWVIQADGSVEKHPIAYWNHQHRDIAPGAVIYLPMASSVGGSHSDLNAVVVELLRNRMP
ncbi:MULTISPECIES: capsule biosynthesis GfcC family protein [unclassified Vibrio]|uniref:Capsule biosynthesis GfcC family protein n=1 Tax=Vibrio sp. HB236076 TaxID=3232307 RepID=A0AB39HEK6_9VIBR|nr:capsule biosynthesis GfcC family protein [Vibrio sp. HB161653]MDP5255276.1 capsule biosynthesis GfcC family protein [Vibrio sp. HB161653]